METFIPFSKYLMRPKMSSKKNWIKKLPIQIKLTKISTSSETWTEIMNVTIIDSL